MEISRQHLHISPNVQFWPALLVGVLSIKAVLTLALKPNFTLSSVLSVYGTCVYFLLLMLSTGFALRNAAQRTGGSRTFWIFMAGGCGLWALDQWSYVYYTVGLHADVPDDSLADPALFLHIVPFMAALAMQPHLHQQGRKPSRASLNFLLLLCFWVFLYAYALLPYQYLFANETIYNPRFTALYAMENATLVLALGVLSFRTQMSWRSVYAHLLGASALYGIGSSLANVAIDSGWPYNGSIYSLVQTAAACWFVWVPLHARQLPLADVMPTQRDEGLSGFISFLAKTAVIAIPLIGMWELLRSDESPGMRRFRLSVVLASVLFLVLAVLFKEYLTKRDLALNSRISKSREKSSSEALERSENRFRILYEKSPIGICLIEARTGRFLQVNPKYCEISGRTEQDLLSRDVQSISDPADVSEVTEKMRRLADGELQNFEMETRQLRSEGSIRWVNMAVVKVSGDGEDPAWNMAIVQDVTDLRSMTQELKQAQEKLAQEKIYLEHEIDKELGFEEIIGHSKALKAVMKGVAQVASSDATVLLLGETGTGKELIARAIHRQSNRRNDSFIKLNCAAIPTGLLESELFGHERGAFTSAVSRKVGRLELADKGTLFLDEIGEIALESQPKLLRVLQDQEFERLGGTQTLRANFRLIAATNRDLIESMREGEFRSDLYYRLNVFPIRVPPLRERREDIPVLVKYFVERFARKMNRPISSIPKETMETLIQWNWPGNIRELENFIERAVILSPGDTLLVSHQELSLKTNAEVTADGTLRSMEREHIIEALRQSRGLLSGTKGAAARLGLKRTTLQYKIEKLGISRREYTN